jgi:acyl-CoA synthetase (AMP-forming)/AMP-acid ligase II
VINVGGRKVYPAEVEQALLGHECIEDAVCIGTRDPEEVTGERVRAFLVARRDRGAQPSPSELADFLTGRLEEYQIPVAFEWVDSIPRNDAGKIERKTRADLAAGSAVKAEA